MCVALCAKTITDFMLTADLANIWQRNGKTGPRLLDSSHPSWQNHAAALISLIEQHIGQRRGTLDAALEDYIGTGTAYRTLRGFIKLLLDRAKFTAGEGVNPAEIRETIFTLARAQHPVITETARAALWEDVGQRLALPVTLARANLYGDLPENQTLEEFDAPEPTELVDEYNLAQAQALLYRCTRLEITLAPAAVASRRLLFDALKRHRLIYRIAGDAESGYDVTIDGPISLFQRSQKYGIQMAAFLPALLLCEGWEMRATITPKESTVPLAYELNSTQTILRSHLPPSFDTTPEIRLKLQKDWERLKNGWTLTPTTEMLHIGGAVLLPDVVWHDTQGREIWGEILGFWLPERILARCAEFARCGFENFILLAGNDLCGNREMPAQLPPQLFTYKTTPDAKSLALLVNALSPE